MRISNRNNLAAFWAEDGRMFIVAFVFIALASAIFWLDSFRTYESEIDVLIVGKSSSVDPEQAASSLASLSKNLSFYDHVLAGDSVLEDEFSGMTQEKRKEAWNSMMTASVDERSGAMSIVVRDADQTRAELFSRQTARTMVSLSSFYYDIRNDIDVRIVDGPLVKTVIDRPFLYAVTSLITALVADMVIFVFFRCAPAFFRRIMAATHQNRRLNDKDKDEDIDEYAVGDAVPYIDPRKFIPEKPAALSFETEEHDDNSAVVHTAKAAAPANLPIADDDAFGSVSVTEAELPFSFGSKDASIDAEDAFSETMPDFPVLGEHAIVKEKDAETPFAIMGGEEFHTHEAELRGEPTVEEYKRRLNELLKGGK